MDSPNTPPLGKYLASSAFQDKKIRDKAIKTLAAFLSNNAQEPLPTPELAKLWKGIFYCYWMSDKPLVQQALSSELAELILTISTTTASISFLRAFWEATVREWNGIDRLRLDKYYMLVRKFTNAAFRLLIRENWQSEACVKYNDILSTKGGPLCYDDGRVPSSLAYHLADIYLEELNKAVESSPESPPVPLSIILLPFLTLAARTPSNATYSRIQTSLLDPLFLNLPSTSNFPTPIPSDNFEESKRKRIRTSEAEFRHLILNARGGLDDSTPLAPHELRRTLLKDIFDVASMEETRDSNRKKMYSIWKAEMDK